MVSDSSFNWSWQQVARRLACVMFIAFWLGGIAFVSADEPDPQPGPPDVGESLSLVPLTPNRTIWIDAKNKVVAIQGQVCLREGDLEMFACPTGTKEHESIVSVNCRASEVHAALLALGLTPGTPMQYRPVYQAATGPKIDVRVAWQDNGKVRSVPAQEWVRHSATKKAMTYDWVFAGSRFWEDPETGNQIYFAEGGELICVSNFPTAALDLPIPSPEQNAKLLFSAFTERIPPIGTEVYVLLRAKSAD